jgi:hypothetical protein
MNEDEAQPSNDQNNQQQRQCNSLQMTEAQPLNDQQQQPSIRGIQNDGLN